MTIVVEGVERPVTLIGVTEGFNYPASGHHRGRYFDSADMETPQQGLPDTKELSDRVFGQEIPIGGTVRMGELRSPYRLSFESAVATFALSDIQPRKP